MKVDTLPVAAQENIILRKNTSLGCLAGLESHQRFHTSIQSWSLANEGFVKSLVTLPDNMDPPASLGQVSTESLISAESFLCDSDNLLEEPVLMEGTSLVRKEQVKVNYICI